MPADRLDIYYLRLSLEDGDVVDGAVNESYSITSQRICIQRFINSEFGENVVFEELADDGYSGTNMERPAMQKLLRLVEMGKVRTIIVRDLSRFARDYLTAGHYLEFVFPAYDVRFISINENFDSQKLGEMTGGLELAIHNLINQMYSRDISKKIKSAVDLKKLNGEFVYGTAPYGYKKGPEKNTIVIDSEVADYVRQIFTWAAEGVTVTQIARRLNEAKVMTPSLYLQSVRSEKYRTRNFWSFESVRNILCNRIYTGDTEPFKSHVVKVGSDRVKMIPEELRQIIPDTHEAIIPRELYYQARTVIKTNRKTRGQPILNPFTSLLVCGCCGNRLSKGKAQNKNWLCSTSRYTKEFGCHEIRMNDAKLRDIILRAINVQCKLLDERVQQTIKANKNALCEEDVLSKKYKNTQQQLNRIKEEKMTLYEDYVNGSLLKDDFVNQKHLLDYKEKEIACQLEAVKEKLELVSSRTKGNQQTVNDIKHLTQYQDVTELTPELTKALIKRIIVYSDSSIKIEWNFCNTLEAPEATTLPPLEAVSY